MPNRDDADALARYIDDPGVDPETNYALVHDQSIGRTREYVRMYAIVRGTLAEIEIGWTVRSRDASLEDAARALERPEALQDPVAKIRRALEGWERSAETAGFPVLADLAGNLACAAERVRERIVDAISYEVRRRDAQARLDGDRRLTGDVIAQEYNVRSVDLVDASQR